MARGDVSESESTLSWYVVEQTLYIATKDSFLGTRVKFLISDNFLLQHIDWCERAEGWKFSSCFDSWAPRECAGTKCWFFLVYSCFDFPSGAFSSTFLLCNLKGIWMSCEDKFPAPFFALICSFCTMHFKEMLKRMITSKKYHKRFPSSNAPIWWQRRVDWNFD